MTTFTRLAAFSVGALVAVAALACNSAKSESDEATPQSTSPAATGTLSGEQGWPRVEGLRGERYCEVLLASVVEGRLNAAVWNTYGLNDCPPNEWSALNADSIKTERGVIAAILNGPRYWLMDAIEKRPSGERQETTFGTLKMFLAATVDLGPIPPNLAPYTERHVARETVFEFAQGAEVYELVSSDGRIFIMQSYSVQRDPTLTEDRLPSLAPLITPPAGWTYRARVLDDTLRVGVAGTDATVLQDDLANTYSLVEGE